MDYRNEEARHLALEIFDCSCESCRTTVAAVSDSAKKVDKPEAVLSNSTDGLAVNEDHPAFEGFIRAFWRRVDKYKNDYGPELPDKMPAEIAASMATALTLFDR